VHPLTKIINQCLQTGIFPDTLKIAKVIPIHKKDDTTNLNNYRPISLLPAISKIFEKVMHKQLHSYFSQNNLFYEAQYGFRPKFSTELAALQLIDQITRDMDSNEVPLCIFLDLSKAFDTINHDILLTKLQHYGVIDEALNLLRSYLQNRKQFVQINDTLSEHLPITTGVPQGSILGPLLFTIYINDLPNACSNLKPIMYADDTTLYGTLSSFGPEPSHMLNAEIETVNNWLKINKLSLNVNKTNFMMFHKPRKKL
jgi:retron-type reverse transcriptase